MAPSPWQNHHHILLPTLFLIIFSPSITSVSDINGASHHDHHQLSHLPYGRQLLREMNGENDEFRDVLREMKSLKQALHEEIGSNINNGTSEGAATGNSTSSTLILAAQKTHRRDPLDSFHYYKGGWDFRNTHYWASVAFSAAPFFITAVVWFLLLGLGFLCACICCCCCRRISYGYSQTVYALSLTCLVLFTISAVMGCVVLYISQEKFGDSVAEALQYIVKKGLTIFENFMGTLKAFASAANVTVNHIPLPPEIQNHIADVDKAIKATADIPQIRSIASSTTIKAFLSPARIALNVLASIMLILAFLGLIFAILGMRFLMFVLVIIGWILVTGTLVFCGVFLVFHNVVADTCIAMDEWLRNPTADSALNLQFLPCMDHQISEIALNTSKETTSSLVKMVNKYITDVANKDFIPEGGRLYFNHSGPLVPIVCNPFNSDMTDRKCAPGEVDLGNVTQEWSKYVCQVSEEGSCTTSGRLTPVIYDQLTATVNVSSSLYNSTPFLIEVGNCSIILDTFNDISKEYCPGLMRYSFRTYVGLVIASTSVMCSLLFWIVYSRERRRMKYSRKVDSFPFAAAERPI